MLVASALIAVGCSNETPDSSRDSTATTTTSLSPATTEPQPEPAPINPEATGQIAFIANTGDLMVINPDGTNPVSLTNHQDQRVSQPVWAPGGGALAWTEVGAEAELVVGSADGRLETRAVTAVASFYTAWNESGTALALLGNADGGVGMSFAELEGGELTASSSLDDAGTPYYFDWLGDDELFAHVGGDIRRVSTNDPLGESNEIGTAFQAPDVLSDGTVLIAEVSDGLTELVRRDIASGESTTLASYAGSAFFVVDPTETRVAVHLPGGSASPPSTLVTTLRQPDNALLTGGVWVIDLESGARVQAADTTRFAAFWDPTGTRLLMLEPSEGGTRWQVWALDGSSIRTDSFLLSPVLFGSYLPFYDQYAKSITFWSPDGSSFVYSAMRESGVPAIFVHDAATNGSSVAIATGSVAIWSPTASGAATESRL
ncbi:MAG: hypothetical protein V3V01_05955 [Acidimicrobiales bacterium]